MNIIERFLRYVSINTRSLVDSIEIPSSKGQIELAKIIAKELSLIVPDAKINLTDQGLLICQVPASLGFENSAHVCLSAHFDTYYDQSGDVSPIIHDYQGGDLVLPKNNVVIPLSENQDLLKFIGSKIITADGSSILGADDKAGLAGIVTAIELLTQQKRSHGPITLVFFPDEEISRFDFNSLPVDLANSWNVFWTIDGLELGTIDQECFIANNVTIIFKGVDAHPGVAGQKLVPAHYAACALVNLLAQKPTPWQTSDRESYIYVDSIVGSAPEAKVVCIPRSFESSEVKRLIKEIKSAVQEVSKIYPKVNFTIEIKQLSQNTLSAIEKKSWVLSPAKEAMRNHGYEPILRACRAGTDGAMFNLIYPNIPAPDMGYGARNVHELHEWIPVKELEVLPLIIADMLVNYGVIKTN